MELYSTRIYSATPYLEVWLFDATVVSRQVMPRCLELQLHKMHATIGVHLLIMPSEAPPLKGSILRPNLDFDEIKVQPGDQCQSLHTIVGIYRNSCENTLMGRMSPQQGWSRLLASEAPPQPDEPLHYLVHKTALRYHRNVNRAYNPVG